MPKTTQTFSQRDIILISWRLMPSSFKLLFFSLHVIITIIFDNFTYILFTCSWFFSSCSRDLAERILVNSGSLGNALMRESSSQKDSGSYVISKIGKIDGLVFYYMYMLINLLQGSILNCHTNTTYLSTINIITTNY